MRRLKALGRFLGYLCLRGCLLAVPLLPLHLLLAIGRGLGDLMWLTARRRRAIADKNLRIAYGDSLSPQERARIARESFRQFGMFVFESMKFATMRPEAARHYLHMSCEDRETVTQAFTLGRGVIFVSAHFGNFELAARTLAEMGHPMTVVVRPARDARTTRLMETIRIRNGIRPVFRDNAARAMIAALRRNEGVAILADQNATDVFVPFFGHLTGTTDGPAKLALHSQAPIIVGVCRREPDGTYKTEGVHYLRPDPDAPRDKEIARIMTEVNAALEKAIRRNPEQWLWFHDRWRSSPVAVPVPSSSEEHVHVR